MSNISLVKALEFLIEGAHKAKLPPLNDEYLAAIEDAEKNILQENPRQVYRVRDRLGSGATGQVYEVTADLTLYVQFHLKLGLL